LREGGLRTNGFLELILGAGLECAAMAEDPRSGQDGEILPEVAARSDQRSEIIRRELQRRLELLEETDDAAFGRFTALDWVVCSLLFFVLPLLIVWWAA
jgi:hypothetical protein